MLACALHSLAEQRRRTRPQQLTQWHSSTVAPGKSVRTKRQLQPCKSQPTRNPLHREHVGPHAHWHYRWFHRRTPGGNIGVFNQEGTKNTSHWHYICLRLIVHLRQRVCSMSNFWAPWSAHFILWQILSWYLQRLNHIEPISMWRQSSHWKNKYVVIWRLISEENMIFSMGKSKS